VEVKENATTEEVVNALEEIYLFVELVTTVKVPKSLKVGRKGKHLHGITGSLAYLLDYSLTHWLTNSLTHSLTHSLAYWLTYSLTN
jgi:hypothetical protein